MEGIMSSFFSSAKITIAKIGATAVVMWRDRRNVVKEIVGKTKKAAVKAKRRAKKSQPYVLTALLLCLAIVYALRIGSDAKERMTAMVYAAPAVEEVEPEATPAQIEIEQALAKVQMKLFQFLRFLLCTNH